MQAKHDRRFYGGLFYSFKSIFMDVLFNLKYAIEKFDLSPMTIYTLIKNGEIIKINSGVFVKKTSIERFYRNAKAGLYYQ